MFYQLIDLSHSMTEWGGDRNRSVKPIQKNGLEIKQSITCFVIKCVAVLLNLLYICFHL